MAARRALMVFGPVAFRNAMPIDAAGAEAFVAGIGKVVADGHGYVAEVDVDGARLDAAVAHGAVVADVHQFFKMFNGNAATGLFFV